jgi:hypothetical protein
MLTPRVLQPLFTLWTKLNTTDSCHFTWLVSTASKQASRRTDPVFGVPRRQINHCFHHFVFSIRFGASSTMSLLGALISPSRAALFDHEIRPFEKATKKAGKKRIPKQA